MREGHLIPAVSHDTACLRIIRIGCQRCFGLFRFELVGVGIRLSHSDESLLMPKHTTCHYVSFKLTFLRLIQIQLKNSSYLPCQTICILIVFYRPIRCAPECYCSSRITMYLFEYLPEGCRCS